MKISKFIENLKWQLETYGDAEVKIDWESHPQIDDDRIFFNRVIGNYNMETSPDKKDLEPEEGDALWFRNYPY